MFNGKEYDNSQKYNNYKNPYKEGDITSAITNTTYLCKCGHSVYIPKPYDYQICSHCGCKVDRTFKSVAEKNREEHIKLYFIRKKAGMIK